MTTAPDSRRRGGLLITMLSILTVSQVLGLILIFVAWRDAVDHGRDGGVDYVLPLLAGGVALAALAGVWALQRWAVYLFGLVAAFGLISDLVSGLPPQTLLIRIALLAGAVVAISQRWEAFR